MKPVSPVILNDQTIIVSDQLSNEVTFAKNQDQYGDLPAVICEDNDTILTRWELSDDELEMIQRTKSIYVYVKTFGKPLQPLSLEVVRET